MEDLSEIDKIIGKHPNDSTFFGGWLNFEDLPIKDEQPNKKHRKLIEKEEQRDNAINQVAEWIVKHHFLPAKIERGLKRKEILNKYGFQLPESDKTQKGAIGEIIFTEYLIASTNLVISQYRLRFNGNVDQALKGDDILFFDKKNLKNKILLGESKYISNASSTGKSTIKEIIKNLQKDKIPLSISQIEAELDRIGETILANELSELNAELHKRNVDILYAGFLMGNKESSPPSADIATQVENHLDSENPKFAFVSLGIPNSQLLIQSAFERANEMRDNMSNEMKSKIFQNEDRQLVVPITYVTP